MMILCTPNIRINYFVREHFFQYITSVYTTKKMADLYQNITLMDFTTTF